MRAAGGVRRDRRRLRRRGPKHQPGHPLARRRRWRWVRRRNRADHDVCRSGGHGARRDGLRRYTRRCITCIARGVRRRRRRRRLRRAGRRRRPVCHGPTRGLRRRRRRWLGDGVRDVARVRRRGRPRREPRRLRRQRPSADGVLRLRRRQRWDHPHLRGAQRWRDDLLGGRQQRAPARSVRGSFRWRRGHVRHRGRRGAHLLGVRQLRHGLGGPGGHLHAGVRRPVRGMRPRNGRDDRVLGRSHGRLGADGRGVHPGRAG